MKQLEIKTNKRLLIVKGEFPESNVSYTIEFNGESWKPICKGSDLTEDIAKGFTHSMNFGTDENPDIGYHNSIKDNYWGKSALESFISAIESKNYHWGENPVKEPRMSDYGWYASGHPEEDGGWMYEEGENKYYESLKLFEEAQSRTFNPSKCIIFEIL
ncbi:hypothetical protein [Chryseobacterium sp. WLY505]|uniref:hypothetical protein n=1 Tax=Chryseobacterium sp. WLY505 TaxID=3068892 RepID=UPI002796733D|nr:hypothetical protein [Chryseobacterium sp. WLY505]MDQ1859286.1 hypothetical protein [Chryseobacterium sp. WLY505]